MGPNELCITNLQLPTHTLTQIALVYFIPSTLVCSTSINFILSVLIFVRILCLGHIFIFFWSDAYHNYVMLPVAKGKF